MAFDKFKNMGDKASKLNKMRKQAQAMQKQLQQEKIEVEEQGVKVVMTGDQKIEEVVIDGNAESRLVDILNKAVKKSQKVAAKKLREMGGGLSGMMGN